MVIMKFNINNNNFFINIKNINYLFKYIFNNLKFFIFKIFY